MRVLVSAASKHGATAEIAKVIGEVLGDRGMAVEVRSPDEVNAVDGYDAVVLGSAVYVGHWLDSARRLAEEHRVALAAVPVWLFSSGPVGEPLKPDEAPVDVTDVMAATGAREHRVFAGRLDRHRLGLGERVVTAALRVPDGDFRDWAAVRTWAAGIADALGADSGASGAGKWPAPTA